MFHEGHRRLLERAKQLGDYLIVGVTTDHYDESRGKLNVIEPHLARCLGVEKSGYADKVITEDHTGQKLEDIIKYGVDIFAIGSDWMGDFDYLKQYCEVVYLDRTHNISSTSIRANKYPLIRVGIVGSGRITARFFSESRYVSGIEVTSVFNPRIESAKQFAKAHFIGYHDNFDEFLQNVDAVYIASPHETHYQYIIRSLKAKKHVLCEKPMVLSRAQAQHSFDLAEEEGCVLMEAIKIAYAPGFVKLMGIVRSGVIGNVRDVEACFTKIPYSQMLRELTDEEYGGSFTELASYNLMAITKLMGTEYKDVRFDSILAENGIDIYTKANFIFQNGFATSKTGLGIKSDGQLLISGTDGYILAKSPWWLMKEFEVCFEDTRKNQKHPVNFQASGLRYELAEFVAKINGYKEGVDRLHQNESIAIAGVMEKYLEQRKSNDKRDICVDGYVDTVGDKNRV